MFSCDYTTCSVQGAVPVETAESIKARATLAPQLPLNIAHDQSNSKCILSADGVGSLHPTAVWRAAV